MEPENTGWSSLASNALSTARVKSDVRDGERIGAQHSEWGSREGGPARAALTLRS